MCFGSTPAPAAPAVVPAPVKFADRTVQGAGITARERALSSGGRQSTVLTGPLGLPGGASTAKQTLLGR